MIYIIINHSDDSHVVTYLSAELESSRRELDRSKSELLGKISSPFSGESERS